jgi:hypothetical protein
MSHKDRAVYHMNNETTLTIGDSTADNHDLTKYVYEKYMVSANLNSSNDSQ